MSCCAPSQMAKAIRLAPWGSSAFLEPGAVDKAGITRALAQRSLCSLTLEGFHPRRAADTWGILWFFPYRVGPGQAGNSLACGFIHKNCG